MWFLCIANSWIIIGLPELYAYYFHHETPFMYELPIDLVHQTIIPTALFIVTVVIIYFLLFIVPPAIKKRKTK